MARASSSGLAAGALLVLAAIASALCSAPPGAAAKGNLAGRCKALPPLVIGVDEAGFAPSERRYVVETGQCYRLVIESSGKHEYAIRAHDFFRHVWLRKIEVGGMEIKAGGIYELEFEKAARCEIFFVPVRPGEYALWAEQMQDKGAVVTFVVE